MAEKTYLQAISDGLRGEMRRDKRVFVLGEDVGVYGGAFKVTLGFQEEFGAWRVIDTPLSETAIVAGATGAAIMGMRPVAEMQFADFVSCAWDHLVTIAAKQRWRAGTPVPIVLRLPSGGGFSGGPFHSQNPESSFAHIPGLKCVCPATPEDAKGLMIAAIEDPNPVLFFEHKHLYRRIKAEVPDERYVTPIGKARIHQEGDDLTLVTWGAMVYTAEEAAKQLPDTSVEIIDLRTIMPWDKQAVLDSVRKTSKVLVLHEDTRTGGFGGEIAATVAEECFEDLDAPVKRIAAPDTPVPFSPVLEKAFIPQVDDVVRGLKELASTNGEHRNSSRRRHAADGRLRLGRHHHQVEQAGGGHDRGGRDAARDLDRQGRHRGAVARVGRGQRDPRARGRDGRRRHRAGAHRRRGRGLCARSARARAGDPACGRGRQRACKRRPGRLGGRTAARTPDRDRVRPVGRREREVVRLARSSRASPPSTGSTRRRCRAPAPAAG